jgi:ribosome-associated protein
VKAAKAAALAAAALGVDMTPPGSQGYRMEKTNSVTPRMVAVRATPIELSQFIKFGGLADSGGAAKQLIAEGGVRLNDTIETRKGRKLAPGDQVSVGGQTIVVALAAR